MKNKAVAILLLISTIFWILNDVYYIINQWEQSHIYYQQGKELDLYIFTLHIIVPISFFIFSIALIGNKSEVRSNEKALYQQNEQIPSVGDWLTTFLIAAIPLIGFIFIIIWASEDKNKIKKNWAIASLIWTGILFILSVFFYVLYFQLKKNEVN